MRLRPCVPPAISPQANSPSSVVSASRSIDEPAVLVVEDGVGEDLLGQRVDPAAAVAAQHVRAARAPRRARRMRVVSSQTAGRPSGVSTPLPFATSSKIACATTSRGPSESVNSSPVGVQEDGAVRARRLRDRVALHRLGPRAAVRVVLERVEVARLRARGRARSSSPRRWRRDGSSRARRAAPPRRSSGRRRRGRRCAASSVVLAAARASSRAAARARRAARSGAR